MDRLSNLKSKEACYADEFRSKQCKTQSQEICSSLKGDQKCPHINFIHG